MRLGVFTNQFPSRPCTFFARDMRSLLDAGIAVDILPLYPVDASLWSAVPEILGPGVLPRERVHALSRREVLSARSVGGLLAAIGPSAAIGTSALRYGPGPVLKSGYAVGAALAWARRFPSGTFDHVLAYWGNYAATAAYLYHGLNGAGVPFSTFVHARMDLYQHQVYLAQKMLYADNIFLVCEFNRSYIRTKYPLAYPRLEPKIHIHHLGLDLEATEYRRDGRPENMVLAVGRFEALKGFHRLLEAVARLAAGGRPIDLQLIGGGEGERELRALAARLGIERTVRFRGWLPGEDVLEAMRQATILVHPPVTLDAMPTVLKEAIAVGTPVIASNLAGIPEILDFGRCGVLVPPGDVGCLAAAIDQLLGDPEERCRLAAAGREFAKRKFDLRMNGRALAARLLATRRAVDPQVAAR